MQSRVFGTAIPFIGYSSALFQTYSSVYPRTKQTRIQMVTLHRSLTFFPLRQTQNCFKNCLCHAPRIKAMASSKLILPPYPLLCSLRTTRGRSLHGGLHRGVYHSRSGLSAEAVEFEASRSINSAVNF